MKKFINWYIISKFCLGKINFNQCINELEEDLINQIYKEIKKVLYNFNCLDNYDFNKFLTEGRSLSNLIDVIEEQYDKSFYKKYGIYMFDELDQEEIMIYFKNKYNVNFQPYTDWVVRKGEANLGINS